MTKNECANKIKLNKNAIISQRPILMRAHTREHTHSGSGNPCVWKMHNN